MENENITVELTPAEAFTLRMILDFVGGDRVNSRRKHAQSVSDKLIDQGVEYATEEITERDIVDPDHSGIYFKDWV